MSFRATTGHTDIFIRLLEKSEKYFQPLKNNADL